MESTQALKANSSNSLGKTINLVSEICYSWGFSGKKKAIEEIAKALNEEGYDVNIKFVGITNSVGTYNLSVILSSEKEVMVFSNKPKDKGAVINYTPRLKEKEIIEKIKAVI